MTRTMPTFCEHGACVDGGDFDFISPCDDCGRHITVTHLPHRLTIETNRWTWQHWENGSCLIYKADFGSHYKVVTTTEATVRHGAMTPLSAFRRVRRKYGQQLHALACELHGVKNGDTQ